MVAYDGEQYPGEVTDIEGVEVSVLHRSGSCWKWSQPKDMIFITTKHTLCILLVLPLLLATVVSSSLVWHLRHSVESVVSDTSTKSLPSARTQ